MPFLVVTSARLVETSALLVVTTKLRLLLLVRLLVTSSDGTCNTRSY